MRGVNPGMTLRKLFSFLVEGGGAPHPRSPIAVIARHRRDRKDKGKTLPAVTLIRADWDRNRR